MPTITTELVSAAVDISHVDVSFVSHTAVLLLRVCRVVGNPGCAWKQRDICGRKDSAPVLPGNDLVFWGRPAEGDINWTVDFRVR